MCYDKANAEGKDLVFGGKMKKNQSVFAFIDSNNLHLGVLSQGWKLDWRKFRQYLRNKYNVNKAYLFIGQVSGAKKDWHSRSVETLG